MGLETFSHEARRKASINQATKRNKQPKNEEKLLSLTVMKKGLETEDDEIEKNSGP